MSTTFRAYDPQSDRFVSDHSGTPTRSQRILNSWGPLLILIAILLFLVFLNALLIQRISTQLDEIQAFPITPPAIRRIIDSEDSGRLFVIKHENPFAAPDQKPSIPTAAEASLLPRPQWSDPAQPPSDFINPFKPSPFPAPLRPRYVTETKGHCKPCRNSTLRTSSTDDE